VRERATELGLQRPDFARAGLLYRGRIFGVLWTSRVTRVVLSTKVPSADALAWPTSKSLSQCSGTVRSAPSGGRLSVLSRS
jgi:hypothetical protein